MQVISNFSKIVLCLMSGSLLTACSSLVSIDDEIPPPPSPREARQLRIPADLAVNRTDRNPSPVPVPVPPPGPPVVQLTKPVVNEAPAPASVSNAPAPVVISNLPPSVANAAVDGSPKTADIFFAPYIPFLKEGAAPVVWQKNPAYDFPWIPGALPARVNEETVVGSGEQMMGRLYAKKIYSADTASYKSDEVKTVSLDSDDVPDKKNKKLKNSKVATLDTDNKKDTLKSKNNIEIFISCEGVTCLDAARDALAADAEAKGWQMLLNRRVSLHQSFQFSRSGRVIWIELNSDGQKELTIEYSLMPKQNVASKK